MSYSADLQTGLLSSKAISIDKNSITYDNKKIHVEEITGFSRDKTRTRINGILTVQYQIDLFDKAENKFKIHFSSGGINEPNMDKHYSRILKEIWDLCGSRLLNEMYSGLLAGKEIVLSKYFILKPQGLSYMHKALFSKREERIFKWEDIDFSIASWNGSLVIKGLGEETSEVNLSFVTPNVSVLHALLQWLHQDSDRIAAIYTANKISF